MLAKFITGKPHRSAHLAGIGLMLLGVFLFSLGDALGKHIVTIYAVGQLLLLRSIAALVLMSPSIWRHRAMFAKIDRPRLQLIRVMLSSCRSPTSSLTISCRRFSSPPYRRYSSRSRWAGVDGPRSSSASRAFSSRCGHPRNR